MSSTTFTKLPSAVQNAVSLLTSRLLLAPLFSEESIEALTNNLSASLATLASRPHFHIVLRINAASPPPPALLAASILSGVSWNQWALALTAGKAVETVMEISPAGVSWTGNGITPIVLRSLPLLSLPKLTLGEKMDMMVGGHKFTVVPPTPAAAAAPRPASPASTVSESSSASSLFDKASSSSSSSITSPASSRCHSRSNSMESLSSVKSEGVYVAPRTSSHRRTQSRPVIDTSSIAIQHFKYQGGETNVVGGGVMLGGASRTKKPLALSSKENRPSPSTSAPKQGRSRAASRATNWRRV
ncbi:hypothetical protein DL96DRAFT_373848 [Flagelloscypha sp. PMI_526]|nr:hypothetical protein DL96DRAFT_373848 [Flagelloscypha sp. PMI_526]